MHILHLDLTIITCHTCFIYFFLKYFKVDYRYPHIFPVQNIFIFPIPSSILLCDLQELRPQTLLPSGYWLVLINRRIQEKIRRWAQSCQQSYFPPEDHTFCQVIFQSHATALSPGLSNCPLLFPLRPMIENSYISGCFNILSWFPYILTTLCKQFFLLNFPLLPHLILTNKHFYILKYVSLRKRLFKHKYNTTIIETNQN